MSESKSAPKISRHVADDFRPLLKPFDLDAYDEHDATIYGVRSDLTLAYVNATWSRFALKNNGNQTLLQPDKILNRCILESFYGPLRTYYKDLFQATLRHTDQKTHEYECSSPRKSRFYHMDILPLPLNDPNPRGLLVINSWTVPAKASLSLEPITAPNSDKYRIEETGLVTCCSNCRRFQRADKPNRWDWVPCYLDDPPAPVTHGLCPVCLDYYYPAPTET